MFIIRTRYVYKITYIFLVIKFNAININLNNFLLNQILFLLCLLSYTLWLCMGEARKVQGGPFAPPWLFKTKDKILDSEL